MNQLISVIVPIYKVEEFLDECVQSIVSQTYTNLEIILVDDGSPDRCPEMCDAWAAKDSRIKVIHKPNGGLSDARNAGLDIARGDYISFIDSDDWVDSSMLETMLRHIQKENASICACGILACYPDRSAPLNIRPIVGNPEQIFSLLYDNSAYPVAACNKLYRKSCWEHLRFPVGKICEDAFTTYKLIHNADKIVQITDALYFYRIRENSIMTASFSKKRMDEEEVWRCNYEFVAEHYPKLQKNAFDFYLQKVNVLIHAISHEQRAEFSHEYNFLYNILKKNKMYLLLRSKLPLKYRIKFILDYIRL